MDPSWVLVEEYVELIDLIAIKQKTQLYNTW